MADPREDLFSIVFGQVAIVDREALRAPLVFTSLENPPTFPSRVDRRDLAFFVDALFEGIIFVERVACITVEHEKPAWSERRDATTSGAEGTWEPAPSSVPK